VLGCFVRVLFASELLELTKGATTCPYPAPFTLLGSKALLYFVSRRGCQHYASYKEFCDVLLHVQTLTEEFSVDLGIV
jgi:hypothetical protein